MNLTKEQFKNVLNDLIVKYEGNPEYYISLAAIYKELGDTDKSLAILYDGLKVDKSNVSAKLMISEILYERWFIDESKKYLEEIVHAAPDNEKALNMLYDIYKSEENFDKALDVLHLKFVFGGNREEILNQIETIKSNIDPKPKISDITKNVREKLTDQSAMTDQSTNKASIITETMADLYISQGQYEKAVAILGELIKKSPNDLHLRTRLSLCQASKMFGKNFVENKKEVE